MFLITQLAKVLIYLLLINIFTVSLSYIAVQIYLKAAIDQPKLSRHTTPHQMIADNKTEQHYKSVIRDSAFINSRSEDQQIDSLLNPNYNAQSTPCFKKSLITSTSNNQFVLRYILQIRGRAPPSII